MITRVLSYIPQQKIDSMYRFETSFAKSYNGREQVQALQKSALTSLKYTFKFKSDKIESVISGMYKADSYIVPIWTQAVFHSGVINSGTQVLNFTIGRRDFSKATHLFICDGDIYSDDPSEYYNWQCEEIVSVGSNQVTIQNALSRTYTNPMIVPAFEAYLTAKPQSYDYVEGGFSDLTMDFTLKDRFLLSTVYTSGRIVTTFKSMLVFDFINYFSGNSETVIYDTDFKEIDLKAGFIRSVRHSLTPPIERFWGFWGSNYDRGRAITELLFYLSGNQTLFYAPTYRNEFKLKYEYPSGAMYIDVKRINADEVFDWMMKSRALYFKTPETAFIKEILDVQRIDKTTDRILFETPILNALPKSGCHICWLILSRCSLSYVQVHQENFNDIQSSIGTIEVRDE